VQSYSQRDHDLRGLLLSSWDAGPASSAPSLPAAGVYVRPFIRTPSDVGPLDNLLYVLLAVYSIGLGRAWSLVGGQSEGILHRLLGLQDVDIPVPAFGGGSTSADLADARDAPASSPAPPIGARRHDGKREHTGEQGERRESDG